MFAKLKATFAVSLIVLAGIITCSCEEMPKTDKTEWFIEGGRNGGPNFTLRVGMSKAPISEFFGVPTDVTDNSKKTPAFEKWVYVRKIRGDIALKSVRRGNDYVTIKQEARYNQYITIFFVDGVVKSARVYKEDDNLENGDSQSKNILRH